MILVSWDNVKPHVISWDRQQKRISFLMLYIPFHFPIKYIHRLTEFFVRGNSLALHKDGATGEKTPHIMQRGGPGPLLTLMPTLHLHQRGCANLPSIWKSDFSLHEGSWWRQSRLGAVWIWDKVMAFPSWVWLRAWEGGKKRYSYALQVEVAIS